VCFLIRQVECRNSMCCANWKWRPHTQWKADKRVKKCLEFRRHERDTLLLWATAVTQQCVYANSIQNVNNGARSRKCVCVTIDVLKKLFVIQPTDIFLSKASLTALSHLSKHIRAKNKILRDLFFIRLSHFFGTQYLRPFCTWEGDNSSTNDESEQIEKGRTKLLLVLW
jgi:hypothetical protein